MKKAYNHCLIDKVNENKEELFLRKKPYQEFKGLQHAKVQSFRAWLWEKLKEIEENGFAWPLEVPMRRQFIKSHNFLKNFKGLAHGKGPNIL